METDIIIFLWVELVSTTDQSEGEGGIKKEETTGDDSTCMEDEFADTLEAPVIHEINPALINTTPGQKITIQVSFTSDEKPSIEWRKGGLLLKTGERRNKVWSVLQVLYKEIKYSSPISSKF